MKIPKSKAINKLNYAKTILNSKLGSFNGKKTIHYDWLIDGESVIIKVVKGEREYKKFIAQSSHDWKGERKYITSGWVKVNESVEVIFSGKGSDSYNFMLELASSYNHTSNL